MIIYVYTLTNKLNGFSYIGISKDPDRRFQNHFGAASHIGNALRKHGIFNFDFEIIDQVGTYEEAFELEIKYIAELNTMCPNGYNLTSGGEGRGSPHSEETKAKMRTAHLGKNSGSMSEKDKASKRGKRGERKKPFSEEHKRNLRIAARNRKSRGSPSKETRKKIGDALRGRKHST